MSFKLPSLRKATLSLKRKFEHGLPTFDYDKIEEKEFIGHGSFGIVYKGKYNDEIVVAKKLHGESAEEENCFVKEAKLIDAFYQPRQCRTF